MTQKKKLRRLALAGQKGGAGKSTVAYGLASIALARGTRVLLVDADPQNTCRTWAAQGHGRGLRSGHRPAQLPDKGPALLCLFSYPGTVRVGYLREDETEEQASLEEAETRHQAALTIIDVPGRMDEVQTAALATADLALIPVGQTSSELQALHETCDSVRLHIERRPALQAAVVLNRLKRRTPKGASAPTRVREILAAQQGQAIRLLDASLSDSPLYDFPGESMPQRLALRELEALYQELRLP